MQPSAAQTLLSEHGIDPVFLHSRWRQLHDLDLEAFMQQPDATEMIIDQSLNHKTAFGRFKLPFTHLVENVIPRQFSDQSHLNIWFAGCSTGETVWDLAFALTCKHPKLSFNILATDIAKPTLEKAKTLHAFDLHEPFLTPQDRDFLFDSDYIEHKPGGIKPTTAFQQRVEFRHHNLVNDSPPNDNPWHIVVCTNVFFYVQEESKQQTFANFMQAMNANSLLLFGPAVFECRPESIPIQLTGSRRNNIHYSDDPETTLILEKTPPAIEASLRSAIAQGPKATTQAFLDHTLFQPEKIMDLERS